MSTLREVFVDWQIKSNLAQAMKELDDAIEDTSDEFKDMADAAEKAAKKTADQWIAVGDRAKNVGKSIAAGIGIGITALVGAAAAAGTFVTQWSQGVTAIESTAKRVGISTQSLQEWQYAAKATGGEAEGVAGIFKELNLRLAEAGETGSGSAVDALTLLKLRVEDLRKLRPEEQMEMIADRLSMISDVGARTFIKDSLFGGEYEKIGSLLEQGSAGIAELRKEASELGGVLDGKALKSAKEFNRELAKTEAVVDGLQSTVAQALLPVLREWIQRGAELIRSNRDLIATKAEEWIRRIGEFMKAAIPVVEKVADGTLRIVSAVGGLDNAVKAAAGGWAAYQVAALAALGPVGAAIAGITAGLVAAIALADKYAGDPKGLAATKSSLALAQEEKRLTDRALEETSKDRTFDPGIDDARVAFRRTAAAAAAERVGASDSLRRALLQQVKDAEARLDAAYAADAAHAAQVDANSTTGMSLGRITKPGGGEKPLTTEALLREQRKREAELEKLRGIRTDLEARRMNASGTERMTIERTLADVNKRITGTDVKGVNELIAEAVGQGTGLGGAALQPAGLGTSINQIDASITINVGGLDVEIPAGMVTAADPRGSAQGIAEIFSAKLVEVLTGAARLQTAQIYG